MARTYEHDVFISFSHEDTERVRSIQAKMVEQKLNVFWSDQLRPGLEFTSEIRNALLGSRHLVIYYSPAAHKSEWVRKEWRTFLEMCNLKDPQNRRIYVVIDETFSVENIPEPLKPFQRPKSLEHLITHLFRTTLHSTERECAVGTEGAGDFQFKRSARTRETQGHGSAQILFAQPILGTNF